MWNEDLSRILFSQDWVFGDRRLYAMTCDETYVYYAVQRDTTTTNVQNYYIERRPFASRGPGQGQPIVFLFTCATDTSLRHQYVECSNPGVNVCCFACCDLFCIVVDDSGCKWLVTSCFFKEGP